MLLPVLLLFAWALLLQDNRPPAGEFQFTVAAVQFKKMFTSQPGDWRMEVTVYVDHTGAAPHWWGRPGSSVGIIHPARFIGQNGRIYRPAGVALTGGGFDEERQQYFTQAVVHTGVKRSAMQPATFQGAVEVTEWSSTQTVRLPLSQLIKNEW